MAAPAALPAHGRIEAFDSVRGVALCMVLMIHCFWMSPDGSSLMEALRAFIRTGWLSVHMFFVLSGYLITGILIRLRGSPRYYRDFYIRRALRILPAYYLILLFIFFVFPLFNAELRDSGLERDWVWLTFYVQNLRAAYEGAYPWHGVGHFWSLGVEEQFYLLWPVYVALLPPRWLPWLCGGIFLFSAGLRALWVWQEANYLKIFVHTLTNLDGLAAGAFIASISVRAPAPDARQVRWINAAGVLALCGLAALFLLHRGIDYKSGLLLQSSIPLMAIFVACLIYRIHHALQSRGERWLFSRPVFIWMGRYSYGIYLLHALFMLQILHWVQGWPAEWVPEYKNLRTVIGGVLTLALTLPLAWLMFRYVEAPALRLARRLTPDSHNPAAEHPGIKR